MIDGIDQLLGSAGLQAGDLDGFGVVVGPGAFTGLRVGLATVKGLALATGLPMVGVSSLQTLAMQAPFCSLPVCTMLDARKKEVYAGLFNWENGWPVLVGEERVLTPDALLDECHESTLFIGDGASVYRTLIVRRLGRRAHFVPAVYNPPRASMAAMLVAREWDAGKALSPEQINPRYLRASEAEINFKKQLGPKS
jgi:tRNA threonylcarbamoyladenosine biosynthesis protein TsaB